MKKYLPLSLAVALVTAGTAAAQGPDIQVSKLAGSFSYSYHGTSGGLAAYSLGTTSCNTGNQIVNWNDSIDQAPAIHTAFYAVGNGRVFQLGYSFLKDSFCALSETDCGSCQFGTGCDHLGIGCADTYGPGLNDGSGGRAKWQLNPATGEWPTGFWQGPSGSLPLRGRIQCPIADLDQPGFRYFGEALYISEHDHSFGNAKNNASWAEFQFNGGNLGSLSRVDIPGIPNQNGQPQNVDMDGFGTPAIYAWQRVHPDVVISVVRNKGEGEFYSGGAFGNADAWYYIGSRAIDLGGGQWRYEYAVYNQNSEQAGASFTVPVGTAAISDIYFRDIDHHSGSPWANTDWAVTQDCGEITWAVTETHAQNPNANALRWATMYNFAFTADVAPNASMKEGTIGMFHVPPTGGGLPAPVELTGDVIVPNPVGGAGGFALFCDPAVGNSANPGGADMIVTGTSSPNLSDNSLTLQVTGLPTNKNGLFFMSQNFHGTPITNFGGGLGTMCLASPYRRFPLTNTGPSGFVSLSPDYNNLPAGTIFSPGETWGFMFWYRDPTMGPTNLSSGQSVTFCP